VDNRRDIRHKSDMIGEPIYGELPSGWSLITIGELVARHDADIQTGPFGTMLHANSYTSAGTPVIAVKHLGKNRILHDDLPRVGPEDRERLSRYTLYEGDIVFGRKGAVERRAYVTSSENGWLQGSDCIRVRFNLKNIDSKFVSYTLGTPAYRKWIERNAQGATMPSLNQEIIGRIPLPLAPLPEQQAITNILGSLDDKIELNRQMNETLEAMARAIFKSWFVDFAPVRAKVEGREPFGMDTETAALFPNEFEDVEGRIVPKEWKFGNLGDVAKNLRRGISAHAIPPNTPYIGLEHMPCKSIALDRWGYSDGLESNKLQFERGNILFGKLRPYFHKVGVAPVNGVCSTDILIISPKSDLWFAFVLGHASSDAFVDYTNAASTGTKMPRTNWQDMAHYEIVIPPNKIAEKFNLKIRPIIQKINLNIYESNSLSAIRDTLLPKLLSGNLNIKDEKAPVRGVP